MERLREWARERWANRATFARPEYARRGCRAGSASVSVRLDRADIGFQQDSHSLSEAEQRQRFSGVQASQPTAPEMVEATADWLLRLTSRGKNVDLFIQSDAAYQASAIRQTLTPSTTEGVGIQGAISAQPATEYSSGGKWRDVAPDTFSSEECHWFALAYFHPVRDGACFSLRLFSGDRRLPASQAAAKKRVVRKSRSAL